MISDPEHPHTLGQLSVVNLPDISIDPPPRPFTFDEAEKQFDLTRATGKLVD